MEAKLIVVGGRANKTEVALKLPTVIGRSREAGLTVAHPMISRRHSEIFERNGLLMIRDLGSLNGTVVEGQRVSEAPLYPGKQFSVGPLTFRADYDYDGDLDAVPAAKVVEEDAVPAPSGGEGATFDFVPAGEAAPSDATPAEVPDLEAMAAELMSELDDIKPDDGALDKFFDDL